VRQPPIQAFDITTRSAIVSTQHFVIILLRIELVQRLDCSFAFPRLATNSFTADTGSLLI